MADTALETEARAFADTVQPSGCNCENNGDWCEWCGAYNDYLENDEEWRREARSA